MTKSTIKSLVIELLSLFAVVVLWYIYGQRIHEFSTDLLVDVCFLTLLPIALLLREKSPRHFWYSLLFMVASAVSGLWGIARLMYLFSGLSFTFLIIGVVNHFLFDHK